LLVLNVFRDSFCLSSNLLLDFDCLCLDLFGIYGPLLADASVCPSPLDRWLLLLLLYLVGHVFLGGAHQPSAPLSEQLLGLLDGGNGRILEPGMPLHIVHVQARIWDPREQPVDEGFETL